MHARVLVVRQAPSLKKWREYFVDRLNKKGYVICFPNIPGKQQHCIVTNRKLVYCFRWESIFLGQN